MKPEYKVPLIDLAVMLQPVQDEIMDAVARVVTSTRWIGGPEVQAFEQTLAAYLGAEHVIGVSSGTDALLATLMALGVGPGDEVITTPFSFFSTASGIARLGATPVFVDIDEETFNLDPARVKEAITPRTRGIIPVHIFGQMADMSAFVKIAAEHELFIIEDAAQAIGASQNGAMAGSIGTAGCFSFFPTKNLGAMGDGGCIVTQNSAFAERVRMFCRHGTTVKYHHEYIGGNFRLDPIQAAVLKVKLAHLEGWNQARRDNARFYDEALRQYESIITPVTQTRGHDGEVLEQRNVYHHYCVRVSNRDAVCARLQTLGVGTNIYYPSPLHLQPCFSDLGYQKGQLAHAERVCDSIFALPVYPGLKPEQREYVAYALVKSVEDEM